MLIPSSNQLEEVMGLPRCEPGVSYFINDKNTGSGVATESLTHQAGMRCGFKRLGQVRQSREQRGMSCCQCFDRERKAQVCFSDSWWPEKHHIGRRLDKRQICQFPQQPF